MAALTADQGIAQQYQDVVRAYAAFADTNSQSQRTHSSAPITFRWRNAGLRAVQAVVSADGLATDGGDSLRIVLPVVLHNLYTDEDILPALQLRLHESEKEKPEQRTAHRRRVSTTTVQTVDQVNGDPAVAAQSAADADKKAEMDVRLLALRCLERVIVSGSSRAQIRIATSIVLRFILSNCPFGPNQADTSAWGTSLIELIANWCPVQVRFVILVTAMELLLETQPTEEALAKPFTILHLVNRLLKSQVNMIGLSVMDVLIALMNYISFVLLPQDKRSKPSESEPTGSEALEQDMSGSRKELLSLLQDCIGNLTTHIYYGDQVADLVKAIVSRFTPATSPENSTTLESVPELDTPPASNATFNVGTNKNAFAMNPAKVTGLRAIKNIFVVANLRKPMAAAGVESRDHVDIQVWEGTQWLLREPDRDVRYAYADAFLSWLKFETSKVDLIAHDETTQPVQTKRESSEPEKAMKRSPSAIISQRERASRLTQSNFLRMLHLTIYDVALEYATEETEILLLHLLLTNLIEKLGVNAVRFGLPMILKLEDDMDAGNPQNAKVNIGSLVYGYLWAITEKFDLDNFKVGSDIQNEIDRRKDRGLWLQRIRLPPVALDNITTGETCDYGIWGSNPLKSFRPATEDLVDRIEEAYNLSVVSPPQSPPSSPNHTFGIPVFGQSAAPEVKSSLPSSVKDQMLLNWSRETCLTAVEQEKAKAQSLSGSRGGTTGLRSQAQQNGDGSPSIGPSPAIPTDANGQGSVADLRHRRESTPDSSAQLHSSSRASLVRVNELRRVLSVHNEGQRRTSPLRSRLDPSSHSIVSADTDSVASGGFSISDFDDETSSKRHAGTPDDDTETPRVSSTAVHDGETPSPAREVESNDIPPVPPIPADLSIPGGFPTSDSQRSLTSPDRPFTAPGQRKSGEKSPPVNANTHSKSLNRRKSRSITGLAGMDSPSWIDSFYGRREPLQPDTVNGSHRQDIENLLNRYLAPAPPDETNGQLESEEGKAKTRLGRRSVRGGIGRPPY